MDDILKQPIAAPRTFISKKDPTKDDIGYEVNGKMILHAPGDIWINDKDIKIFMMITFIRREAIWKEIQWITNN